MENIAMTLRTSMTWDKAHCINLAVDQHCFPVQAHQQHSCNVSMTEKIYHVLSRIDIVEWDVFTKVSGIPRVDEGIADEVF
ncbi:hypothetical protein ACO0LL_26530 [Undibacterium sp. TC4M20W]|uniref:hypothetical protein n=1 Tax=Undibacterium sp. TC4M20W TaxID=3413052 RepID=UPI003BF3DCDD